jgi:GMP synthase-like glutamine amidotransferase
MQNLGILACGQVREDLVADHGEYPGMFTRLLQTAAPNLTTTAYRIYAGEYPASLDAHDAYLISGSRFSVYDDDPWIRRLEDFVRALYAARIPTVGICFGHQMMARALGGVTEKAPQGWGIGKHVAQILRTPAWMQPAVPEYGVFVSHQDQVTHLPPAAERLATSTHCPNSMFVVDNVFLGIQGHPEFTAAFARDLASGRASVYGDDVLARALQTYGEASDSSLVARWIVQFLTTAR